MSSSLTAVILERDCFIFESPSRSNLLLEHDVLRKPVPTFRHHALTPADRGSDDAAYARLVVLE
jgi:hypothetical protein